MKRKPYQSKLYKALRGYLLISRHQKCELCNYKSLSNEVHHIDHDSRNNNIENLMLLCKRCHAIIHKSKNIIGVLHKI